MKLNAVIFINVVNKHFDSTWERRTLGVGFYQLAQDQEKRKTQIQELNTLRSDTLSLRNRSQMAKLERQKRIQERREILKERVLKRKKPVLVKQVDEFLSTI